MADSDAESADLLAEALRRHGYAVRTAYSQRQCLRLVSEFRPHLVVLFLPAADLTTQLRSEVPVINAAGLEKPLDVKAIVRLMHDALAG